MRYSACGNHAAQQITGHFTYRIAGDVARGSCQQFTYAHVAPGTLNCVSCIMFRVPCDFAGLGL
jgi:hypothetical protein